MNKKELNELITAFMYNVNRLEKLIDKDLKDGIDHYSKFGEHKACLKNIGRYSMLLRKALEYNEENVKEYCEALGYKNDN